MKREGFLRFFKFLSPILIATLGAYIPITILYFKVNPVDFNNLIWLFLTFAIEYLLVQWMFRRFVPEEEEAE